MQYCESIQVGNVDERRVVIAAAKQHHGETRFEGMYEVGAAFSSEDDAIAFYEDVQAYKHQQAWLDSISEEEAAELKVVLS